VNQGFAIHLAVCSLTCCVVSPIDFHGKTCGSNEACGAGLACVAGVCGDPVDAGTDAGVDAGIKPGCPIVPPPSTCTVTLADGGRDIDGVVCGGHCQAQDVFHCTRQCIACPGAVAGCDPAEGCVVECSDGGASCGVLGCMPSCPAWWQQPIAGEPFGSFPAGTSVAQLFAFDSDTVVGVGWRVDGGGFAIETTTSGEPWTLIQSFPVGLRSADYADRGHGFAVGDEGSVFLFNAEWSCVTGPSRSTLLGVQYRYPYLYVTDRNYLYATKLTTALVPTTWSTYSTGSFRGVALSPNNDFGVLVGTGTLLLNCSGVVDGWTTDQSAAVASIYPAFDLFGASMQNSGAYFVWGSGTPDGGVNQGIVLYSPMCEQAPTPAIAIPPGSPTVRAADVSLGSKGGDIWLAGDKGRVAHCLLAANGQTSDAGCPYEGSPASTDFLAVTSSPLDSGIAWVAGVTNGILATETGGR
jgi:hypothetical protein